MPEMEEGEAKSRAAKPSAESKDSSKMLGVLKVGEIGRLEDEVGSQLLHSLKLTWPMKITIFPSKYHQNGGFFMAMLVSGRVRETNKVLPGFGVRFDFGFGDWQS